MREDTKPKTNTAISHFFLTVHQLCEVPATYLEATPINQCVGITASAEKGQNLGTAFDLGVSKEAERRVSPTC